MTEFSAIEETRGPRPIEGVATSIAAFVGRAAQGPVNQPVRIESFRDFEETFGGLWPDSPLGFAVRDFFANEGAVALVVRLERDDGAPLTAADFIGTENEAAHQGLYALDKADLFNLLCIPPHAANRDIEPGLVSAAAQYCEKRRAFLIVDAPGNWNSAGAARTGIAGGAGTASVNAALYFPRLLQANPLRNNQVEAFAPCGAVAGVMARTDSTRGVWKGPAGQAATVSGVTKLSVALTDAEGGALNMLGINCLRMMPTAGIAVWGARTIGGQQDPEWKYVNVRRLVLFVEESIYRGTQWVVFEPNGPALWAQINTSVTSFLTNLWRAGALQGSKAADAWFVKCDAETMTQDDINNGVVNIQVGLATVRPAEFVILRIQQRAA